MDEQQVMDPDDVPTLTRRRIELDLAATFVEAISARYGTQAATDILRDVVEQAATAAGGSLRERLHEPGLDDLVSVWASLAAGGALDVEVREQSQTRLRLWVTRCGYAEAYRASGLVAEGIEFSCRRDAAFARALIPGVELTQSRTIAEGATRCEFEYRLDAHEPAVGDDGTGRRT